MKITLQPTACIADLNHTPCRLWLGQSDGGLKIAVYVAAVAHHPNATPEQCVEFERELLATVPNLGAAAAALLVLIGGNPDDVN